LRKQAVEVAVVAARIAIAPTVVVVE